MPSVPKPNPKAKGKRIQWKSFSVGDTAYRCAFDGDFLLHVIVTNKQGDEFDVEPRRVDPAVLKKGLKFAPRIQDVDTKKAAKGARAPQRAIG
jgi:hypothetical protein